MRTVKRQRCCLEKVPGLIKIFLTSKKCSKSGNTLNIEKLKVLLNILMEMWQKIKAAYRYRCPL